MMTFLSNKTTVSTCKSAANRTKADVLIVPYWEQEGKTPLQACKGVALSAEAEKPLQLSDFTGKLGQTALSYSETGKEPRVLLLGLGPRSEFSTKQLRRAYAAAAHTCGTTFLSSANVYLPDDKTLLESEIVRSVIEGVLLSNYRFCMQQNNKERLFLQKVRLIGPATSKDSEEAVALCEGVLFARDLVNENADQMTPAQLAKVTRKLAQSSSKLKATILDAKHIAKEGLGLLEAVGRGSEHSPRLILLSYKGSSKSSDTTVLVGKGVTYDTGGLNLKNPTGMEHQRSDMGGAAAVLGAMHALAALELPVNVTAVIPSAENAIDARSYKQGDVYTSYSGKTVEVGNTDAEGRLILADALSYALRKLKPTRIIDYATLTGAIIIALGDQMAGLFSNNDQLAEALIKAGTSSDDQVWRLPLIQEYCSKLKSDRADLKNVGDRGGSSITAALFLEAFVDKTPWAHIDIAGVRFRKEAKYYNPKGATGYGVRLTIDFLRQLIR